MQTLKFDIGDEVYSCVFPDFYSLCRDDYSNASIEQGFVTKVYTTQPTNALHYHYIVQYSSTGNTIDSCQYESGCNGTTFYHHEIFHSLEEASKYLENIKEKEVTNEQQ
jgi:hypothetical protein